MFIDEITIKAKAGNGGNGVVRWRREKAKPWGGPAGGNGGKGGDVFVRAVRDHALLFKYKSEEGFYAENGGSGEGMSRFGKGGEDYVIDVPVGSIVTDLARGYRYELMEEGQTERILKGGNGGLGNEYFKSSTNRSPEESTKGREGEEGEFHIELLLSADVGIIGLPNAGKSSLLNALTNASSRVGAYPFTTIDPHLGDLHGFILADVPGLIEGAAAGKGLGHKFLRHVKRTKMLVHCISSEEIEPMKVYETVRNELESFDPLILDKTEWVVFTKSDLVIEKGALDATVKKFEKKGIRTFILSILDDTSIKNFSDELVKELRKK